VDLEMILSISYSNTRKGDFPYCDTPPFMILTNLILRYVRQQNLGLCSELSAFEQEEVFFVPQLL
jgi:hypothetical protein